MAELWVECRPGAGGEPVPRRFGRLGGPWGEARDVVEVLDRWDGEGHRYFRVRDDGGARVILRHDTDRDTWRLHFLDLPAGGP